MFDMETWRKERDEALLSMDEKKIRKFMKKYNIDFNPSNDVVFWAAVHKAIIEMRSAPAEQKRESAVWLVQRGFKPGIY